MMLKAQRPTSLRLQAIEQIRKAIVTGAMAPGSLHSEQSIADRMSISRTPVREALLQLEQERLIEFIPHRGARVRNFDATHLSHIFEMRAALESHCAAALARDHKPEVISDLEGQLDRQQKIIEQDDGLAWVIANMDFHLKLVSSLGNRLFDEAMPPLASHTMRIGYRMNVRKERMKESLVEHSALVGAIRSRDEQRARSLASSHLYITTILMKQLFSDLGDNLGLPQDEEQGRHQQQTAIGSLRVS
jgi:DNA-binding GntR family transcriptional regulator